jgi:hypothetical protein
MWEGIMRLGSLSSLRQESAEMTQASLSSDYAKLAQSLPSLIGQTELANLQASDADRLHMQRLLSDVYATAGWALIKAESPAAAWIAAQRAVQLAEHADDVLRSAAAMRCLAEVHMRAGSLQEASRTAFLAATCLDTVHVQERGTVLCLRGTALLSPATAALDALLQAEAIAPDELRNHRRTHEVLRDLLSRERRSSGLRALANRCKLLN